MVSLSLKAKVRPVTRHRATWSASLSVRGKQVAVGFAAVGAVFHIGLGDTVGHGQAGSEGVAQVGIGTNGKAPGAVAVTAEVVALVLNGILVTIGGKGLHPE